MSKEQHLLVKLKKRYLYLRGVELLLFSIALALISYAVTNFFTSSIVAQFVIAVFVGVVSLAIVGNSLGIFRLNESRIAKYLNQHYPQLESSTDLLLDPSDELSTLQLIQKSQVYNKLQLLENEIRFPHRMIFACALLAIGLTAWFVTHYYLPATSSVATNTSSSSINTKPLKETVLPVGLNQGKVFIIPPSYTRVASSSGSNLSLKLIEGSSVKWAFVFSGEPIEPSLIFSGKDTIRLKHDQDSYTYQKTFTDGGFYQLTWKDQSNKVHQSDYFPIEIIKDEAPKIVVQNLTQFIELKLTDRLVVDLKANLSDDFGLSDSRIIATVSKGSGESVKFREEILRFTHPTQFIGKNQLASRSIDILKLGLEPGDELYFYIEARDNKIPTANKSRTETFFIALQDTTNYEMTEDQGLGVDLMPEYFRSQRQIIIDSEKILAERKAGKIKKEDFNSKSNELGYDQKVLRLRYGQFMGEEADSGIAHEVSAQPDEDEDEDPMKKFGHQHDTENEHHLVADKKSEVKDNHDHNQKEGEQENPMAAFMHNHDDTEEATFFAQSVKTKLKAALTLMWDAELYLRMYQPEQSLPYQYKILKLLKEISNDSRVYVHRSGFDPPPLKEEKRLSGDLTELKDSFNKRSASTEISYPSIRMALPYIETLLHQQHPIFDPQSTTILQKAGNELAGVALQQPGVYLKSLSSLKSILNGELKEDKLRLALLEVQQSFWQILPQEAVNPSARKTVSHPLDDNFIQQLEALKHER